MTTTTLEGRTFWDAIFFEPLDLIKSQPPQILISAASAYLIAAEAAVLLPSPANWALAIGAEWGYLRGMASAAGVETKWKDRLTYANGALVVLYGALFSLRKFGAMYPVEAYENGTAQTDVFSAVVMTLIHIACIGAVTVCAMMAHSAMISHQASVKHLAEKTERERNQEEYNRQRQLQAERDHIELDMERKRQELAIWTEGMEAKARLKMQSANARTKMRRDAHQAQTNADEQICPKCGAELDRARWLAARRWGYCMACKNVGM